MGIMVLCGVVRADAEITLHNRPYSGFWGAGGSSFASLGSPKRTEPISDPHAPGNQKGKKVFLVPLSRFGL